MDFQLLALVLSWGIFVGIVSIGNFMALGAPLQFDLLLPLIAGAVVGAIIGPRLNKAMKNQWLQAVMAVIVAGIGLKYVFL